jgi:hypothetical protein
MSSPRRFAALIAGSALMISAAAPAHAASDTDARAAAIAACKVAVAAQFSTDVADVRLDRIATRSRTVEIRLEARKDGARVGLADCTYNRRAATTQVAVVGAPTQTAKN